MIVGNRTLHDRVTYPRNDRIPYLDREAGTRRYTTLKGSPADPI